MRGTRIRFHEDDGKLGIIPAYAGNTPDGNMDLGHYWDHPRVCGEHHFVELDVSESTGSSPRMRGTPDYRDFELVVHGIIPAYAGNTLRD